MIPIRDLPLSLIDVPGDRAREADPAWVEALARLIEAQGLIQPVRVRNAKVEGRFRLVAGLQRLRAHELLGRPTIMATVSTAETDDEARLEEVMENLGRAELNALDRCRALWELKAAHERLNPLAKHGGDRRSIAVQALPATHEKPTAAGSSGQVGHLIGEAEPQVFGLPADLAERLGLSARTIRRAAQIWDDLTTDSRRRVRGTRLEDNQSELQLLSQQKPGTQKRVLDVILDPANPADGVRVALEFLSRGQLSSSLERKFALFAETFAKLPDPQLDHLAEIHADRLIASLRRLGRI